MARPIEDGKAKAAGVVGIMLLCFGLAIFICGIVWISYGGGDGTGLWSSLGVGSVYFFAKPYVAVKSTLLYRVSYLTLPQRKANTEIVVLSKYMNLYGIIQ